MPRRSETNLEGIELERTPAATPVTTEKGQLMAQSNGDVVSILTHDHREVEELFGQIEQTPQSDHDERRRLVDQAIVELVRHSVAEEQHLYPAARQHIHTGATRSPIGSSPSTTRPSTMKKLEQADAGDSRFNELLGQLMQDIRQHVQEEENELFPQLSHHTDKETLEDLGKKVSGAKAAAPTRPHPSAPSERPELMKVLGPGAGLVDRARDKLSGRGK